MIIRRLATTHILIAAGFILAACANSGPSGGNDIAVTSASAGGPNMTAIAQGTALPAGYKVDPDRTIIFGTDDKWTGRLSYTTSTSADDVFDFLHKEMPNFGWTEVTAMRSDLSLLTFSSASTGRFATINIVRPSALGSTRVDMVVAPQSGRN